MRNIVILLLLSCFAFANTLELNQGEIKAHTEVFGDSKIDPSTKDIKVDLNINQNNITSIRGNISILSESLKSQKETRDEHMHKLLESKIYPSIIYRIKDIKSNNANFMIRGTLRLNGISKEITTIANIVNNGTTIQINGKFNILLTNFNMKPPKLLFLTVRNKIDIQYNLSLKQR